MLCLPKQSVHHLLPPLQTAIILEITVTSLNFQVCGCQTAQTAPTDYKIWGIIQQRVYQTNVQDMNDLIQHLIGVWAEVEHSAIDDAMTSGTDVSIPACEPQEDILNTDCGTNWSKHLK